MNRLIRQISDKLLYGTSINNVRFISEYLNNYEDCDRERFKALPFNKLYTKTIIYKDPSMSLELLSWGRNQKTRIHDHAKYGCFMKLMEGHLQEKLYDPESLQFNYMVDHKDTKEVSYIENENNYHKILNPSKEFAYSLHIYIPGNYQTKYCDYVADSTE